MAAHTATYSKLYPFVTPALVNGAAGAVIAPGGRPFSVMAFTVTNGKITAIDALLDPERLAQMTWNLPGRQGDAICEARVAEVADPSRLSRIAALVRLRP